MNAHGEAPAPDWSLSDLSDEEVERIAERCETVANMMARAGNYFGAENQNLAAKIVRQWAEQREQVSALLKERERELRHQQQVNEVLNMGDGTYRP